MKERWFFGGDVRKKLSEKKVHRRLAIKAEKGFIEPGAALYLAHA